MGKEITAEKSTDPKGASSGERTQQPGARSLQSINQLRVTKTPTENTTTTSNPIMFPSELPTNSGLAAAIFTHWRNFAIRRLLYRL
jgi:hypothetical protein